MFKINYVAITYFACMQKYVGFIDREKNFVINYIS